MFKFTGGMLTGAEIERQIRKGNINITPYDPRQLNPNSYNLKLHPQLLIYKRNADRANLIPDKTLFGFIKIKENDCGTSKTNVAINQESISMREASISHTAKVENECVTTIQSAKSDNESSYNSEYTIVDGVSTCPTIDAVEEKIDDVKHDLLDTIESNINDVKHSILETIDSNNEKLYSHPTIGSLDLEPIDMNKANETIEFTIPEEGYVLQPGIVYIGRTVERTGSDKYIPMINGRSSGGRLGISIHVCAGFGDVGFDGTWTLEITCVEPVRIYPNTEIAQVCYFKPVGKVGKLYRGRYFGQIDATASKFYRPKEDY